MATDHRHLTDSHWLSNAKLAAYFTNTWKRVRIPLEAWPGMWQ